MEPTPYVMGTMLEGAFLILEHEKELQHVANSQINELVLTAAALLLVNGHQRPLRSVRPDDSLTIKQRIAGFVVGSTNIMKSGTDFKHAQRRLQWTDEQMADMLRACGIVCVLGITINRNTLQGE